MQYFVSPKVLFGKGTLTKLGPQIEGKGSRAALITDKTMSKAAHRAAEVLRNARYEVMAWDGAEEDPAIEVAVAGSKVLLDFNPDWVIGFGGGSAMDTAKAHGSFMRGRPAVVRVESLFCASLKRDP